MNIQNVDIDNLDNQNLEIEHVDIEKVKIDNIGKENMETGNIENFDNQNLEIEKKYTIKKLPENLDHYPCKIIEQAYLNTAPVVRVRKSNDTYYLTYKGSGLMAREEYNLPLDEASYRHLLTMADGNIISKKRYVIPIEKPQFQKNFVPAIEPALSIELDVFAPPFAPLVMAEVEFPSVEMADAFIPPAWFDEEVTNNPEYHNSVMSRKQFSDTTCPV